MEGNGVFACRGDGWEGWDFWEYTQSSRCTMDMIDGEMGYAQL